MFELDRKISRLDKLAKVMWHTLFHPMRHFEAIEAVLKAGLSLPAACKDIRTQYRIITLPHTFGCSDDTGARPQGHQKVICELRAAYGYH